MKANTIIAIAVSIGVLLVAFVQAAILIAGGITSSKAPTFGPSAWVWDSFLVTSLVFLVDGVIYGLIAGSRGDMPETLTVAAVTGIVVALALVVGTPSLVHYVQQIALKTGQDVPFSVSDSTPTAMTIGAIILWVGWYVMGAAIGYRLRNRKKAAQS